MLPYFRNIAFGAFLLCWLAHAEGYLGSDDLLARLALAETASINVVEGPVGQDVCPMPVSTHELYPYLSRLTQDQKNQVRADLTSPAFRAKLGAALRRLKFNIDSPPRPFGATEEAFLDGQVPGEGDVVGYFNNSKLQPYSLFSLARVVSHESVHIALEGLADNVARGFFSQLRTYADAVGACVALSISGALRLDGVYHTQLVGERTVLVLRMLNEREFSGFFGADPGSGQGRRFLEGSIDGDKLSFRTSLGGNPYEFSATLTFLSDKPYLNGYYWKEGTQNKSSWFGAGISPHFADFTFANFAITWRKVAPGDPILLSDQLAGKATAMYAEPIRSDVNFATAAASLNIKLDAQPSSAGFLISDTSTDHFVAFFFARQDGNLVVYAWKGGKTTPILGAVVSSGAGSVSGRVTIQKCDNEFRFSWNGTERLRLSDTHAGLEGLQPDLPRRTGIILGGTGTYVSNFVIHEPTCP